uniref:Uncharacterized protein n=1 Tax=Parascaris univalens TaxID=6257 RepID=A0A914ZCI3_PARUN
QQYYELNFDKLRDMWYTGMMRGVLKAKAKNLCESLSQNECTLYSLCASDARSLVALAKCVVTLLDERDRQIAMGEEHRRQLQAGVAPVESEIFSRFPSFEHMNKELRIMLAKLESSMRTSLHQQNSVQSANNEIENRSITMKSHSIQPLPDEVINTHYQSSASSSYIDHKIPANTQTVKKSLSQEYPSSFKQLLTTFTNDHNDTLDQRISVEEKTPPMKVPLKVESYKLDISDINIRSNYSRSLISSKFMVKSRKNGQIIRSQKRRDHKNSDNKGSGKHRYRTPKGNSSEQRVNWGTLFGNASEQENLHKRQEGIARRDEQKTDVTTEPQHTKMRSTKITWPKTRNESEPTPRNLQKRSGAQSDTSTMNRKERRRSSSRTIVNKGMGTSRSSSKEPSNVKKLRIIRDHFSRLGQINEYIKRMNQENSRFLHEINVPMESKFETIEDANQNEMLNDIVAMINAFQKTGNDGPSISIMSPRLFSIIPGASKRPQLLSPTLLSFQKDGFFSMPDLFDMATSRKSDAAQLVDLIVELSGAATVLNKLYEKLQPQIKQVKEVHLPTIREFERQEQNWQKVIDSYSEKQKLDLKKRGYAHLAPEQLQLIYDKPIGVLRGIDVNWTQYANMSDAQREQRLEASIRELATFDENILKRTARFKRQRPFESAEFIE